MHLINFRPLHLTTVFLPLQRSTFLKSKFFHDSKPPGPLTNRSKQFCIWLCWCWDILFARRLTPCCPAYHGDWHRAVLPTTETDTALSCLPRRLTPLYPAYQDCQHCPAHLRDLLSVVLPIAEADSTLSCLPRRLTPLYPAYHSDWISIFLCTSETHSSITC